MKTTLAQKFLLTLALAPALLAQKTEAVQEPDPAAEARRMLESAEAVMKEVEELRGWKFKAPVRKDVRTREQLRVYIEKKLFEEEFADGKLERTQAWLRCLGLMPAGADFRKTVMDVLLSQIGGFYDPDENAFFMMTESAEFGADANRMMIAHELCHALDDQYVDLGALSEPEGRELTEDETYVVGGVVEGSATALMFAWMAKAQRAGNIDMEAMAKMAEKEQEKAVVLIEAPPYFTLLAANYMVGQHFLTKGADMMSLMTAEEPDTGAAILEVSKDMPRSSEQMLHPGKYWDPEKRDEPVLLANDDDVAALVAKVSGRAVLQRDTLGEMVCALTAAKKDRKLNLVLMARANYWTNKYGRGWGGDRLFLLGRKGKDGAEDLTDPGVVWVTAWDTEKDCAEFVGRVQKFRGVEPGLAVVEHGRVAVFGFGAARTLDADALRQLLDACRFEKDGEAWTAEG